MDNIFVAEMVGTMILILLGERRGRQRPALKSKGQNSGWIVITAGWGFAVSAGVAAADIQRRPPQPGGDHRLGDYR